MSVNESRRLQYKYAQILMTTRKCVSVFTSTTKCVSDAMFEFVELNVYDLSYQGKYYINGAWYEDAAGTIPWSPST